MASHPPEDGRHDSLDEAKALPATTDSDSLSSESFRDLPPANQARAGQRRSSTRDRSGATANAKNANGDDGEGSEAEAAISPEESGAATAAAPSAAPAQPTPGDAPEVERSKLRTSLSVAALCCAVFLAALDVTITTVAIPTISADFHSTAGYTWIGSAYLLANAAAAPSWGKISDIFGRKPVMLTAVGVFWIGSLLCGVSVNMGMLIFGRAVQGIGGGGSLILVNICISDMFSVRKRGVYLGFVGMVWAVAGGFGPGEYCRELSTTTSI